MEIITKKSQMGDHLPANNCWRISPALIRCGNLKIDDPANDPKFGCTKPELADELRGGNCLHSTIPSLPIKPE